MIGAFFILCGGVVVGFLARGRGRSGGAWGFLTCVLTFVVNVLITAVPEAIAPVDVSLVAALSSVISLFATPIVAAAIVMRLPPAVPGAQADRLRMYRLGSRERSGCECVVQILPEALSIEAEESLRIAWQQIEEVSTEGECVVLTCSPRGARECVILQPLGGVDLSEARILASAHIAKRISQAKARCA